MKTATGSSLDGLNAQSSIASLRKFAVASLEMSMREIKNTVAQAAKILNWPITRAETSTATDTIQAT
jgi:hypothetical protein